MNQKGFYEFLEGLRAEDWERDLCDPSLLLQLDYGLCWKA